MEIETETSVKTYSLLTLMTRLRTLLPSPLTKLQPFRTESNVTDLPK